MESTFYIDGKNFNGISYLEPIEYNPIERMEKHFQIVSNSSPSFYYDATIKFIDPFALIKLCGLYDFVIDNCNNRRVVHLIKYGKNYKIRKKNFKRALKMIRKELV